MFKSIRKINLPKILIDILNDLHKLKAKPILVGGCVRDNFLAKEVKDYDIEVFGLNNIEIMQKCLEKYTKVKLVGKSFGVLALKINSYNLDFSLPRLEKKTGDSHQDFKVKTYADLSFKQAAKRRDFTINAIGYDYFENSFLDEFGGIEDLKNSKIRHIDDSTFVEDSLRVYRAIQFASRFEFNIDNSTKVLCKKMIGKGELKFLPKERIFEEFKKLFLKSNKPSIGLKLLKEFNIFNLTKANKNIDNLAKILKDKNFSDFRKLYLFYSCLAKTYEKDFMDFLNALTNNKKFIKEVLLLQKAVLTNDEKDIKRLSLTLKLEDLIVLNQAFKNDIVKEVQILAKSLNVLNTPLKPLVQGKDLINLGFEASEKFKEILDFALNLQINLNLSKDKILNKILKTYR